MRAGMVLKKGESELLWFHRGTAPMAAIYPDALTSNALVLLAQALHLQPMLWACASNAPRKSIFPQNISDSGSREFSSSASESVVHWFHRGTAPLLASFPADLAAEQGGGAYTGPLDLVPGAVVAYSQRAIFDGDVANAIRLENLTTAQQSFSTAVGNAVVPADVVAFINGGTGYGVTFFDKSGNGYHIMQVAGSSVWTADGSGSGKPAFGSSSGFINTAVNIASGAVTIMVVGSIIGGGGPAFIEYGDDVNPANAKVSVGSFYNVPGDIYVATSNANNTASGIWVTQEVVANGVRVVIVKFAADGACTITVDGNDMNAVLNSGTQFVLPGCAATRLTFPGSSGVDSTFEGVIWNSAVSAGGITSLSTNALTYYTP